MLAGCGGGQKTAGTKTPPAKIEPHPQEADVYRVTLTPQAADRLGITTARVERKLLPRQRTFGGELIVPPGKRIVVTAPLAGTLKLDPSDEPPQAGARVEAGQKLYSFLPLLSPERDVPTPAERVQMAAARATLDSARAVADGDVMQAEVEIDAATVALNRAERLVKDNAGSVRGRDEAQAALDIANKKLEAAQTRKRVLDALTLDAETGQLRSIDLKAPQAGVLNTLSAVHQQTVAAGAPLFEIVDTGTLWVRVPVYVGQLDEFDRNADAKIGPLNGPAPNDAPAAAPVAAPPSADLQAASVDLYYELPNLDGWHAPGQRVGVTLPLRDEAESLVVPWAAVLFDYHGTAWVYEKTGEHVFRRRRVLVRHALGDSAVLESGPEVGTEIVVDGAAELFGTEFGTGK